MRQRVEQAETQPAHSAASAPKARTSTGAAGAVLTRKRGLGLAIGWGVPCGGGLPTAAPKSALGIEVSKP